jgi:hypothetical protein
MQPFSLNLVTETRSATMPMMSAPRADSECPRIRVEKHLFGCTLGVDVSRVRGEGLTVVFDQEGEP